MVATGIAKANNHLIGNEFNFGALDVILAVFFRNRLNHGRYNCHVF